MRKGEEMTSQEIKDNAPDGATHTNGKSYYLEDVIFEGEKPEWYRWIRSRNVWSEVLRKPRNIRPL